MRWSVKCWRPVSLLIVALLLGFALGGASLVMAAGGTITACVNQQGIFRLLTVGSCTQNETSITWNQTGPQGPAGPQGATGPVGPQGPAGQPGGGLATTVLNTGGEIPTGATGVVVSTLNLPAGSYSILGRVSVSGTFLFNGTVPAGTDLAVSCNLVAGSDTDTERVSTFVPPVPGDSQVIGNITLSVLHTFTAPASATITCRGDSDPAGLESSRITAVQVTSIQ